MSLVVLGDRALAMAAVASVHSGEVVSYSSSHSHPVKRYDVVGPDTSGEASLIGFSNAEEAYGEAYILIAPAEGLYRLVLEQRDHLAGKPVLLAPGGFGGVLRVQQWFEEWGLEPPKVGEIIGWPAAVKPKNESTLQMVFRKRNMPMAAISDAETAIVSEVFSKYMPDLVASDLVTTSLSNINTVGHPALAMVNATRMENGEKYELWKQGFAPAAASLMEAIDSERLALVGALGGEHRTLHEWMIRLYGEEGLAGSTLEEGLRTFPVYRDLGFKGPNTLDDRFLTTDLPWGLAAYEQLLQKLQLPHSVSTAVRTLAETLLGQKLHADPKTVNAFLEYAQSRNKQQPVAAQRHI